MEAVFLLICDQESWVRLQCGPGNVSHVKSYGFGKAFTKHRGAKKHCVITPAYIMFDSFASWLCTRIITDLIRGPYYSPTFTTSKSGWWLLESPKWFKHLTSQIRSQIPGPNHGLALWEQGHLIIWQLCKRGVFFSSANITINFHPMVVW